MNLYLGERDIYGPCMMRGSASTQVSIDYTSTADCLRKLRAGVRALVPMLPLMCDNAPVFEGKPREHQLVRTDIWQHVDNDRCGPCARRAGPSFDLRRYAEYILDTVAILIPCQQQRWCYSDRTLRRYLRRAHDDACRGGSTRCHVLHRRAPQDLHRDPPR